MKKPVLVYYLHYLDPDHLERAYSVIKDYVVCVMVKTNEEAIEKAKIIANNPNIKIMGLAKGREEWVNETTPLDCAGPVMPLGGWNKRLGCA